MVVGFPHKPFNLTIQNFGVLLLALHRFHQCGWLLIVFWVSIQKQIQFWYTMMKSDAKSIFPVFAHHWNGCKGHDFRPGWKKGHIEIWSSPSRGIPLSFSVATVILSPFLQFSRSPTLSQNVGSKAILIDLPQYCKCIGRSPPVRSEIIAKVKSSSSVSKSFTGQVSGPLEISWHQMRFLLNGAEAAVMPEVNKKNANCGDFHKGLILTFYRFQVYSSPKLGHKKRECNFIQLKIST